MIIKGNSKTKFYKSKTTDPNKKSLFKGYVTADSLNVRTWAGANHDQCKFSPLKKGAIVSVCDALLSNDNKTWYYIETGGHYGFVSATYITSVSEKAIKFVSLMQTYHNYVKAHGKKFKYQFQSSMSTFEKVKAAINAGKKVGITCLVPASWGLAAMGIKRSDGKARVSGENGSFKKHYTGGIKTNFDRITKGGPIGKTCKGAIDKGLLLPGDFCAFKGRTHTFVYSGEGYIFYEGGHAAMKDGVYTGTRVDYSKKNAKGVLNEVLRWKS